MARLMRCKYCGTLQDEPQGAKLCVQCGGELSFLQGDPWADSAIGEQGRSYVKAQLELDQVSAPSGQVVERYLVMTVQTPEVVPVGERAGGTAEREPMHFAAVLDTSGSMRGSKIEAARAAVRRAVDRLQDGDVFSLVTFSTDVRTLLQAKPIDGGTRRVIASVLQEIDAGGQTALCGGLERGISEALAAFRRTNLVLLLSDGQANVGETEIEAVGRRALDGRSRGVVVSTLGVGHDYNEALMAEIAIDGGGRFYHVERASQIAAYLAGELGEMASLACREAVVQLDLPPGASAQTLTAAYPVQGDKVLLGDIPLSTRLEVVVRLLLPTQTAGTRLSLGGTFSYVSPAGHAFATSLNRVTVRYDQESVLATGSGVVKPVVRRVLGHLRAAGVLATSRAATRGHAAAQEQSELELTGMRRYADLLGADPAGAQAVAESAEALAAVARPGAGRARAKAATHAAMRTHRGSKDFDRV